MSYPPTPWALQGAALCTLQLVDIERARRFVPRWARIVPVLPGRTIGVVYLARYFGPDSALEYSEFIVAPALIRYGSTWGSWISHIYVDNADSMLGGREIWGLPKQLAQFDWDSHASGAVIVRQADARLCTFRSGSPRLLVPLHLRLRSLSQLGTRVLRFSARASCRFGLGSGTLDVPASSPLAALDLAGKSRVYYLRDLRLVTDAPRVIGNAA